MNIKRFYKAAVDTIRVITLITNIKSELVNNQSDKGQEPSQRININITPYKPLTDSFLFGQLIYFYRSFYYSFIYFYYNSGHVLNLNVLYLVMEPYLCTIFASGIYYK